MMQLGRISPEKGHNLSNQWLVTFGDLLTLILCFFVVLLSTSPLSPYGTKRDHAANYAQTKMETQVGSSASAPTADGTRIAEMINELREETLIFTEEELGKNNELSSKSVSLVSNLTKLEHFTLERVVVESCAGMENPAREEQSWFQSIARSLRLRSQLIDTGIRTEQVGVRAVGPWCSALEVNQGQNEVAAVIRIRSRRTP